MFPSQLSTTTLFRSKQSHAVGMFWKKQHSLGINSCPQNWRMTANEKSFLEMINGLQRGKSQILREKSIATQVWNRLKRAYDKEPHGRPTVRNGLYLWQTGGKKIQWLGRRTACYCSLDDLWSLPSFKGAWPGIERPHQRFYHNSDTKFCLVRKKILLHVSSWNARRDSLYWMAAGAKGVDWCLCTFSPATVAVPQPSLP